MSRYLLTIAYDGTRYAGWQQQRGADTVQARLEAAVAAVTGHSASVQGSGRTDAGVHALRQCAHVDVREGFDPASLTAALNSQLPEDIAVRGARTVADDFHARFQAVGKRYVYRCRTGPQRPVHGRQFVAWVPTRRPLDLEAMRRAAAHLVGEHDFAAFATNPGYERSRGTVREVSRLHLIRRGGAGANGGFDLFIQGNGFLYNMVRTIAGTLVWVGRGKLRPADVLEILEGRDRRAAGPNAPASGLFMQRVLYGPELRST